MWIIGDNMNNEFIKDISKAVSKTKLKQELSAGATPRRFEPEGGVKKLNERIHRESKYSDLHKNLPFSFRKPPKPIGRSTCVRCKNCGHLFYGTTATVGIICSNCKQFSATEEVELDG
jgi:formylmethanofuran dehydrogenase subunit E